MWVFTKNGFISIVKHRDLPDTLMVRARRREDLARPFPGREDTIVEMDDADYRYRVNVPNNEVQLFLLLSIDELDYDSHCKEAMAGKDDPDRYTAYLDVWSALYAIQPGAPKRSKWWDDYGDPYEAI